MKVLGYYGHSTHIKGKPAWQRQTLSVREPCRAFAA